MTGAWAVVTPLLAAVVGASVGGLVVHRATLARERLSERRGRRLEYLVSAYRRLEDATNRSGALTGERADSFESALADVMLLGRAEEIEAARQFLLAMREDEEALLDPVLRALRRSLRRELRLEDIELPHPWNLRLQRDRDAQA